MLFAYWSTLIKFNHIVSFLNILLNYFFYTVEYFNSKKVFIPLHRNFNQKDYTKPM